MAIKISLGRTRHSGVDNGLDEGNQRHSSTVFRAGGGIAATPEDPHNDFQPVARAAPQDGPASGLSRAFRSDQTPPFPEVLASLFGHSDPNQRAALLNRLLGSLGPGAISALCGLGGLSGSRATG